MVEKYSTLKKRSAVSNTAGMMEVIQTINEMKEDGVILDFVIGGGAATSLYAVPYTTEDIDFFCIYKQSSIFIILDPLFDYLKERGGRWIERNGKKTFILGIWPIDFTPATTDLVTEAMKNAKTLQIDSVAFKIFSPEYLVAVALETNRAKDLLKVHALFDHDKVDIKILEDLLTRYNLGNRWEKFLSSRE